MASWASVRPAAQASGQPRSTQSPATSSAVRCRRSAALAAAPGGMLPTYSLAPSQGRTTAGDTAARGGCAAPAGTRPSPAPDEAVGREDIAAPHEPHHVPFDE